MKRVFVFIYAIIFVSAILLSGCRPEDTGDGPVTLTYWHLWGGSRTELIEKLIADYEAANPNVTIEATFTPPRELKTKVVQAAGTGTLPDVVQVNTGWYVDLQPAATLTDLTDVLAAENIVLEDILVPAEAKRSYFDGNIYSLPNVNAGAQGLFFFNEGLMRQAGLDPATDLPTDWDSFVEVSKTVVETLNDDVLNIIAWDPQQSEGQTSVVLFSYGAGNPILSPDGRTALLNSPGVLETARALDNYVEEVYGKFGGYRGLLEWNSRIGGAETTVTIQAFIQEAQVFYVSGSWAIGQVSSGNPDIELNILPVPGFNGPHGGIAKDGWSYAISQTSKNQEAAYDFLKYITIAVEGNGEFCIAQGRPCPIAAVNSDPAYAELGDVWTNLVAVMNLDVVPEVLHGNPDIWIQDIPSRRIDGESIEDIFDDINLQYQDYLDDLFN